MSWFESFFEGIAGAIGGGIRSAFEGLSQFFYNGILSKIHEGILEGIGWLVGQMNGIGSSLFELSWVKATVLLFSRFGFLLYLVGVVVAIFDIATEHSGMISVRRQILPILWGFLASGLFCTVPVLLYTFCTDLQLSFSDALVRLFFGRTEGTSGILKDAISILSAPATIIQGLFMLICIAYGVIKCFLDNIKRGGILLLQIAVGSLHMFAVPRGRTDGFFSWCRGIAGICFTAFMQSTFLVLGLATVTVSPLLGAGVILAAGEVPRIAQQFGLETGLRVNVMGAVSHTSRMLSMARAAVR